MEKQILGIGSALVDALIQLEDNKLLENFGLLPGSMTLVDAETSKKILDSSINLERTIVTGGSAANTIRAITQLKGNAGFLGKIGIDDNGAFFRDEFERIGAMTHLVYGNIPTGLATTLISPDSERTFGTYLGAASELSPLEISEDILSRYDFLHVEGYLVFNHGLIEAILKMAKNTNLKVSLDMASFNVVETNLDFLKYITKEYVDILFANEEEALSFTGFEPEKAVKEIAGMCEIAVVKIGRKGSLIQSGSAFIAVDTPKIECIDTTGAGDVYAAGFLYGLANGFSLSSCGNIGSMMASRVIQVLGAKVPDHFIPEIIREIEKLK